MSKFPDWVLKYKKKGTEIRYINGHYYLYAITSRYDKQKKRAVKVTLGLLGKITPEGFIESEKHKLKKQKQIDVDKITIKEYGLTAFIHEQLSDYVELLKKHFPDYWQLILILSYLRIGYQSAIKNYQYHYQRSYLSEMYSRIGLSKNIVTEKLKQIGRDRERIRKFFKEFRVNSDILLFDGTDFYSESKQLRYSKNNRSKKGTYRKLANIMYIFSQKSCMPYYYRIFSGDIKDVKAFKLSLEEAGIEDAVAIGDKGFYSEENVKLLEENKLYYIIPLKRNSKLIDYEPIKQGDYRYYEGHFFYESRVIWYYQRQIGNRRVIVYKDENLSKEEAMDYLLRVEKLPESYSMEGFYQEQYSFGTLALITNVKDKSAKELYEIYKSRHQIEKMFDVFKNLFEMDRSYIQDEEMLEGWMFINYIAMHWYYRLYLKLKETNMLKRYSVRDMIRFLIDVKKVKINNQWYYDSLTKKNLEILHKIGIHIP